MSVLIKGMKMPNGCDDCPFESDHAYMCNITRLITRIGDMPTSQRPDWCPLVEVPTPHGELVDVRNMINTICEGIAPCEKDMGFKHPFDILRAIKKLPIVIEAEQRN